MNRVLSLVIALLLFAAPTFVAAQSVPMQMTFQGRLAKPDGTPVADTASQSLTFKLYSAPINGNLLWQQSGSLPVRNGVFAARFDFSTGYQNGSSLASVFNGSPVYLEVQVGSDAPLSPRQPLASNAYAFLANTALNALGVAVGSIGLNQLAANVLNFANLSGTISANQIAAGSITGDKLASSTITSDKLQNGGAPPLGTAGGDLTGTYPNPSLLTSASLLPKVSGGMMGFSAGATSVTDQAQLNGSDYTLYNSHSVAQSFTPSQTQLLAALDLRIGSSRQIQISILTGETASGTPLYSATFSASGYPAAVRHFTFPGTLPVLQANQLYTFVVTETDSASMEIKGSLSNPYPNGHWLGHDSLDLYFQTYALPVYGIMVSGSLSTDSGLTTPRATVSGNITAASATIPTLNGNVSVGGNLGVGTTAPNFPLSFSNTLGDKISLWGQTGAHYGLGIQGGLLQIHADVSNSDIVFGYGSSTTLTETMRIKGTGNVGIGTTLPAYKLDVNGQVRASNVSVTSDARYKTHIATFPDALDTVLGLRGVTFDWNRDLWQEKNFAAGRQVGFIAQEVESVLPELVTTDANGYKSVAYQNVVPVLVEAVKTLKKENDAKDAEIASMKARLDAIEKLLQTRKP